MHSTCQNMHFRLLGCETYCRSPIALPVGSAACCHVLRASMPPPTEFRCKPGTSMHQTDYNKTPCRLLPGSCKSPGLFVDNVFEVPNLLDLASKKRHEKLYGQGPSRLLQHPTTRRRTPREDTRRKEGAQARSVYIAVPRRRRRLGSS